MSKPFKPKPLPLRQRIRVGLLYLSFLLFPATLYYFSPILIVKSGAEGIINGSFIAFALMFVSSLFVGRLWCGWACPGGGLQDFALPINSRPTPGGKFNWVKWFIWTPWIIAIAVFVIRAGGYQRVEPLYEITHGVTFLNTGASGSDPWFIAYYIVIALFAGLAVLFGRRAGCHTICWMAPFMILGRKLRNVFKWPSLRLVAAPEQCSDCQVCGRDCPMSLDVPAMVQRGDMENSDCILCGKCADSCAKHAIHYSFSKG